MTKPVVYWTSRALRVRDNPALSYAQHLAFEKKVPLKVVFVVYPHFPYANERNMHFLLSGLKEMQDKLKLLNIPLECILKDPVEYFQEHTQHFEAIVMDHHVLKPVIATQKRVIEHAKTVNVKTYVLSVAPVVPVEVASPKLEFSARTIRPKIMGQYKAWLQEAEPVIAHSFNKENLELPDIDVDAIINAHPHWKQLKRSVLKPGEDAAYKQLEHFINKGLQHYGDRNEIDSQGQSNLSAYLHFGMISPKVMISKIESTQSPHAPLFVEEALVRRELAENYCHYQKNYDSLDGAWPWAKTTLLEHVHDPRLFEYNLETFEQAKTHDALWNHCMQTMIETGYLHSYLRMYWAKMVLYWTKHPEDAIKILIHLNDTYFLDGRDPNGYTGIMWSVAGVHDRPWFNRPITGLIRAMGLEGTLKKTKIRL
ncbi:MAG: deoxyribodipyrimidine photo-lyase [Erysipelothrix sp.]|jgi:deoxyribodipyrimidine photo-lyase|nr:deoxyribodipyrimidine photo-lyase [Erysipelothrix sp.]